MYFEKVSFKEFLSCFKFIRECDGEDELRKIYDDIIMPVRSTKGSIGYDFFSPFTFELNLGYNIIIPTGIRCVDMPITCGLFLYPRSGQGFKYRLSLANTVGVIDSDYAESDNEGHIKVKLSYDGIKHTDSYLYVKDGTLYTTRGTELSVMERSITIKKGDKFCQGIVHECMFVSSEGPITKKRNGGFGSTDDNLFYDNHKESRLNYVW